MTVITLTTVGFSEIHDLSGSGRIFTIGLIFMGVVNIAFLVNRFTAAVIEGYFQKGIVQQRQKYLIESLNQHYILCGFGRTAQQIAIEFTAEQVAFGILDTDPEMVEKAQHLGYGAMVGDATLDETLVEIGIERAIGLVATLPSDAENLYIVLSAKTLNPKLRAIARANTQEAVQKLQRAGADAVVSPYITSGKRMAAAALRPQVMNFVEEIMTGRDRSFYIEEFKLNPDSCPYLNQTLQTVQEQLKHPTLSTTTATTTTAIPVAIMAAIRRADGRLIPNPQGDVVLMAGDVLICMGTAAQLQQLHQTLSLHSSP
jgi:voltage-gated potassium channel